MSIWPEVVKAVNSDVNVPLSEKMSEISESIKSITKSNIGKDLYKLGIPRGFPPVLKALRKNDENRNTNGYEFVGSVTGVGKIIDFRVGASAAFNANRSVAAYIMVPYKGVTYKFSVSVGLTSSGSATGSIGFNPDLLLSPSPNGNNEFPTNCTLNGYIPFDGEVEMYFYTTETNQTSSQSYVQMSYLFEDEIRGV